MVPLVLGPLLKALVERLQVALVLLAEVPVALDLVAEHPMVAVLVVAALMVHQVIALLEAIALSAKARVMTDHQAMETVGPPVMGTAVVMAEATVMVMVVATAEVMAVVMVMVESSRPDDLVFKKLYGSP